MLDQRFRTALRFVLHPWLPSTAPPALVGSSNRGSVFEYYRVAGFQEAVAKAPGIQIVTIQPANSERATALTVMENILTSNPNLNAVFVTSDQMTLGAIEGLAAQHLTGKIVVVGFDAGKEAVRAVKSGAINAVIAQYPANMGKEAVEASIKAIRGEPIPKVIDTGTAVVTKENADQFLK